MVEMTGVEMTGVEMTGVEMTGVEMTGVEMTGVEITGGEMIGGEISGGEMTGGEMTGRRVLAHEAHPRNPELAESAAGTGAAGRVTEAGGTIAVNGPGGGEDPSADQT